MTQKISLTQIRTTLSYYLQFAINTSKPPAPVALQGRLCLSGKPHEYKRSLVWLNLPPLAKLGIPRAGVATALNLQSPAVTGAPLHPTSPPPKKILLFLLLCPSMEMGVVSCILAAMSTDTREPSCCASEYKLCPACKTKR